VIDITTKKPLRVTENETAGPYIMLAYSQVDEVRRVLDRHGIRNWLHENVVTLNGGPEMAIIGLGRGCTAAAVQAVLDSAAQ